MEITLVILIVVTATAGMYLWILYDSFWADLIIQSTTVSWSPPFHLFLYYSSLLLSMGSKIINKIAFMTFTLVKDKDINQKKSQKCEMSMDLYEFIWAY